MLKLKIISSRKMRKGSTQIQWIVSGNNDRFCPPKVLLTGEDNDRYVDNAKTNEYVLLLIPYTGNCMSLAVVCMHCKQYFLVAVDGW